jgi:hypothetical protein
MSGTQRDEASQSNQGGRWSHYRKLDLQKERFRQFAYTVNDIPVDDDHLDYLVRQEQQQQQQQPEPSYMSTSSPYSRQDTATGGSFSAILGVEGQQPPVYTINGVPPASSTQIDGTGHTITLAGQGTDSLIESTTSTTRKETKGADVDHTMFK